MSLESLLAMGATMLALSIIPGPSDALVISRALAGGFRAALPLIVGIILADIVFILIAVTGLSWMAQRYGSAFVIVKLLAASYLFWLAVQLWWARPDAAPGRASVTASGLLGGFLITLADPRAIFFYAGLLPTFLDMHQVGAYQAGVVIALATMVIAGVKAAYAWLAVRGGNALSQLRHSRWPRQIGAVMLSITGFYLSFQTLLSLLS
tara:strand:- start:1856 stop:2479 length:624 start_codon:yes stop_codon:yes gene_type:complete